MRLHCPDSTANQISICASSGPKGTSLISSETVTSYLERLASKAPTPGGGAAAAMQVAQGAALVSMVAEFTAGPRFRDVEAEAEQIAKRARILMRSALYAAQEDERCFGQLSSAYRMPKDQTVQRSAAIQEATVIASEPLVSTVEISTVVVTLAQRLLAIGNPSVLSDVAAAAEAARAATRTAVITLEMNIAALHEQKHRDRLSDTVKQAMTAIAEAEQLSDQVRAAVTV
ncbi:formimidoyltetrahydrofolate cyclodeaminase [Arthrobacter sp. MYb213]|nr:formimidoyltetrahydrofolate cyclodeaminase [Arthrobacter sp. MYb213]